MGHHDPVGLAAPAKIDLYRQGADVEFEPYSSRIPRFDASVRGQQVAGGDGGMSCKGDSVLRREVADPKIGRGRGHHEGGFRLVRLPGDQLHLLIAQPVCLRNNSAGIAVKRRSAEGVDVDDSVVHVA